MPDEPRQADGPEPKDDDLDAELAEFEAGLSKAIGPIPDRKLPDLSRIKEPEEPPIPELPTDEEIEARLSKAIQDAEKYIGPITVPDDVAGDNDIDWGVESPKVASKFDDLDREFEERIGEFDGRAKVTLHGRKKQLSQRQRESNRDGESARGLGAGITVAYAIIGFPLIGAGIGWLLATEESRQTAMGLGVVVGMVIGVTFGMILLNRFQSKK
ncbi:MAG TPA: hypothetical protein PLX06_13355 [Fimbriimonadaceae bacterium]|nr:hypothetical protein [Fimbriimonadaceae bacterium]